MERAYYVSTIINDIAIYNTPDGWYADFSNSSEREKVWLAFGELTIPLPYTSSADPELVAAAIRRNFQRS